VGAPKAYFLQYQFVPKSKLPFSAHMLKNGNNAKKTFPGAT
jgi:hypothetical protein